MGGKLTDRQRQRVWWETDEEGDARFSKIVDDCIAELRERLKPILTELKPRKPKAPARRRAAQSGETE